MIVLLYSLIHNLVQIREISAKIFYSFIILFLSHNYATCWDPHHLHCFYQSDNPWHPATQGHCQHYQLSDILTLSVAIFQPSGFMLGRRWILVLCIKETVSWSPARYDWHRWSARWSSSSLPSTSLPCMLATYFISGSVSSWWPGLSENSRT